MLFYQALSFDGPNVTYLVLGLDIMVFVDVGFVVRQIVNLIRERRRRMAGYQRICGLRCHSVLFLFCHRLSL